MALKPKPDYEKDPNTQLRKRAARRSANRNAGLPIDAEPEVTAPVEGESEGGIVAEAEQELAGAKEEQAEGETPAVEAEEQKTGEEVPEAEAAAEETPAPESEASAEETPAPEAEMPVEEEPEMPAEEPVEEPGEYAAPEGEPHEALVRKYVEAIAYGDIDSAVDLYFQLQDHRYQENKHRAKSEAASEAEAREHLAVAKALAAKHPELNEDGLASDKVLALADVYKAQGLKPAAALKQAVADLYPEQPSTTPEAPAEEMPAEESPAPASEEAAPAEEAAPGGAEEDGLIPDMEERSVKKRAIAEVPTASARNEPAPPPEKPTRTSAIAKMKAARGQG